MIRVFDSHETRKRISGIWNDQEARYDYYTAKANRMVVGGGIARHNRTAGNLVLR
jgi:hypothetical protein